MKNTFKLPGLTFRFLGTLILKLIFILFLLALTASSCEKDACEKETPDYGSIQEDTITRASKSVAIIDAKVRSLNKESFVKEFIILDFSNSPKEHIPNPFSFEGTLFADDGNGYDLLADDGVFTSAVSFKH